MNGHEIVLSEDQHLELSRIAQSRSLPAGYVFRARLILMLSEGASFGTIKGRLRTTAPTISRWKGRFLAARNRWTGHLPFRATGHRADPGPAGQDTLGYSKEPEGWIDSLELPQACRGSWYQQRRRAPRLERSRSEPPTAGPL